MYRRIEDFLSYWDEHTAGTEKVLAALTDKSLSQSVGGDHRTLGRLAWHSVGTIVEMLERVGCKIDGPALDAPVPATAAQIAKTYGQVSRKAAEFIKENWTDATLEEEDDMYGETWKRGVTLRALIHHEIHHRHTQQ